nr:MAG TPA: outer capsid protein sigma-1 attachment protein [Caudoviricetes sp.]
MRKIIKRKIHISTHKRDLIDFINDEFYSHDKHNAFIEFTMKSLPTDNIIALFYFQKTKRYIETKAFVDGDKFTIEFDTSLITADETVLGFIYFEKVAQSADVHRFSFGVKVSEIDKLHDMPIEEAKTKRVVAIEDIVTKSELDELFKRIEKNGGTYNDTEIRSSISSIEERVHTLESKPDKDTVYDDSDVKNRLNALESNASRYLTEHQPLTSIEERIQQVEARFNNLSNIYLSSHQSLDHLATNDALDKLAQRVEQLEQNRGSQPAVDNHDFVTRKELEDKHYLTSVPEEYAKKSDLSTDSELRNKITQLETNSVTKEKVESVESRVQVLENKSVVTHEELENAGYAKTTDLINLATNSKVEAVESRVLALENKPAVVPQGYDDSGLSRRVSALEAKPEVDVSMFAKKTEVPTIDSVNNLLRTQGEQATKISVLESKSAYEIHGTGMPNGSVTAPIGTTYVDMSVTNGALKWIKQSGSGNTGWKVLIGDTGWRTLNSVSRAGNSFIKIRRVNNLVTYQFGGLSWGWFGVGRRGGPGFLRHNSSGDKGAKVIAPNGIPEGFRSENSIVGPTYDDKGRPYGIWYLGGKSDLNFIQFTFNENIPTDKDIGDIRVSAVSYITDEDWPTRLP